jgi:hypothetical protein
MKCLFIAFYDGRACMTVVRLISDVPVTILEVFHSTLHTASTHAEISIDVTVSI